MHVKMEALKKIKRRDLVKLSKRKKSIEYKLVFTGKYKSDDLLEKYKARLVAKYPLKHMK